MLHDLDLVIVRDADCAITYANGSDGLEHWNNVEKIELPLAGGNAAGATYTVRVSAQELTESPSQKFALVISGAVEVTVAAALRADPNDTGR